MRTAEYSVEIEKPVDAVYDFSVDPGRMAEWIGNDETKLVVDDSPLAIGSTYKVQQGKEGNRRRALVYEILALEPKVMITEKTSGRLLTYTLRRTFAEGNGKTTVNEFIEMEDPSGVAKLLAGFMLGRVKKLHRQSLLRLKAILEKAE
jgi:uncharacterized protein YndB with AHSA1/START domain